MIDTPTEDCRDRRFDARDDSVGIEIERYLSFAAFLLSERRAGNLCVRHLDGKREVASLEILESGLERSTLRSCKGNPTIAKTILDKPKREFWEDKIPRGPAVVIRLLALVAGETRTVGAVVETLFPLVGYLLIIGGVLFAITAELEPLVFRPIRLSVHGLDLDLAEELTQARARVQAEPEKVKPAWDLGRVKLEVYVNRNLNQIAYIFWLSVAVMTVGFAFIFFGISR